MIRKQDKDLVTGRGEGIWSGQERSFGEDEPKRLSTKKGIASAKTLKKELIWRIGETVRKPMWLDW